MHFKKEHFQQNKSILKSIFLKIIITGIQHYNFFQIQYFLF